MSRGEMLTAPTPGVAEGRAGSAQAELSVVVPVYGCAGCLRALHKRITDNVLGLTTDYEIIFVDDRSEDGSWEALEELALTDGRTRAVGLSRNFGQHVAITAGLNESRARWTVVMDCDLQEPPEAIPHLYAKTKEGYDLVRTIRTRRGHARWRRFASRAYRRLISETGSDREYSTMSMLSRPVVDAYLSIGDRDQEHTLVLDWLGFRQAEVEIEFADRVNGNSAYTPRRLLNLALAGMFFHTTVLLRVVVFLGFLIAFAGAGLAAYNLYVYFAGDQPTGYTSLAVLLLLLSGFIIISIGVVGLYVGRIFEQVKSRPAFVISRRADGSPGGDTGGRPQDRRSEPRIE